MRLLRWLLVSLTALVVALLVAGYVTLVNYPLEDLRALIETRSEKLTGRKLTVAGPITMDVSLSPTLVLEEVTLADDVWAGPEPLLRVKRLELKLALLPLISDEIAVERLALVAPQLRLKRDAQGRGNWQGALDQARGGQPDLLPSFKQVEVSDGEVLYLGAAGAPERKLLVTRFEAGSAGLDDPLSGGVSGKLDGSAFDVVFSLGSMREVLGQEGFAFSLAGSLSGADLTLDGKQEGGFSETRGLTLDVTMKAKDLAQLSPLFGATLPAVGPLSLSAKAALAGHETRIDLTRLKLRNSEVSGKLVLDAASRPTKVTGSLEADSIMPAQLLIGPWAPSASKADDSLLVPAIALPEATLSAVEGKLDFKVGRLDLPGGDRFSDLTGQAQLTGGRLALKPLRFTYAKGRFDLEADLDASQKPPALKAKGRVAGLDAAALFNLPMTGTLEGTAELSGAGGDLRALVASSKGRTQLRSGNLVMRRSLPAVLSESLVGLLNPLFSGSDNLELTCAISDFRWTGGVGRSEATAYAGRGFVSTISGDIDLLKERLDLFVQTVARGVGLAAVTPPFRVAGPLADPSVYPDPGGTALTAARTAGMVVLPPLLIANLLAIELRRLDDPRQSCSAAVKRIEAEGGTGAFVARWTGKTGAAAQELLEDAGSAVGAAGSAVGEGLGEAGGAVKEGAEDAVRGLRNLFSD
ncbi:MAG: hypothetical protein Kilf2KO_47390 [Rhodospirillales bacterium]